MDYELAYSAVGILSFIGWGALALSPLHPKGFIRAGRIAGIILALAYIGFFVNGWDDEPAVSFGTLEGVITGLSIPSHMITAWVHFLAFDLLIGSWIVEQARRSGVHHLLVLPCLALTFLFGPAGFILFLAVETVHKRRTVLAS